MNFTFGIVTNWEDPDRARRLCNSIKNLNIPNYETIVIGSDVMYQSENLRAYPFYEAAKPGWITRKKNIILF